MPDFLARIQSIKDVRLHFLVKGALTEFLAVALFVYICCGAAMTSQVDLVVTSLAFGFTILVLASNIGHVSGGHINPAVTVSLFVTQRIGPQTAVIWIVSQILGGIAGAALLYATLPVDVRGCLGSNGLAPNFGVEEAFILEAVTTFTLVFTVFGFVDHHNKQSEALGILPIGISVLICHLISIPLTGCGINPARSFGPALVAYLADLDGCSKVFDDHWVFWIAPIVGGIIAAFFYDICLQESIDRVNLVQSLSVAVTPRKWVDNEADIQTINNPIVKKKTRNSQ